jgi:hypothetical protein
VAIYHRDEVWTYGAAAFSLVLVPTAYFAVYGDEG